jgi:hypothetical protein
MTTELLLTVGGDGALSATSASHVAQLTSKEVLLQYVKCTCIRQMKIVFVHGIVVSNL